MPSIEYIFMAMIGVLGLIMVITGQALFFGKERYTEESVKKYARPAGVAIMLVGGLGCAFFYTLHLFFAEKMSGWIVIVCMLGLVLALSANIVIRKKTLVKK